jgi:hypothetical protein
MNVLYIVKIKMLFPFQTHLKLNPANYFQSLPPNMHTAYQLIKEFYVVILIKKNYSATNKHTKNEQTLLSSQRVA